MIDVLQYKELEAYGNIHKLKDHSLCFLDMNPYRGRLDVAVSDRPIGTITFPIPSFFQRYIITNNRFDENSIRDVRENIESVATLDDLLKCQEEVKRIKLDKSATFIATILTESFSSCIHNRDYASERWVPPCMSQKLEKIGEVSTNENNCTFFGEICSTIKSPMVYRIDEALILLAKSFAWLEGGNIIKDSHIYQALPYVVGNRLELRDSIAKHWVNPSVWVVKELMPYLNTRKLNQWREALTNYSVIIDKNKSNDEKQKAKKLLTAFASKNLELRPLANLVGISDFQIDN